MQDNIYWIQAAAENKLVVGSQARILYADAEGRIKIAEAFNCDIIGNTHTWPKYGKWSNLDITTKGSVKG